MANRILVGLSLGFASIFLAPPALASDWYVDSLNGSNSNGGTSTSDAWRTITWAVAHAPAQPGETIHVTGYFDASVGEQFPIAVRSGQRIVGPSDPYTAIVSGNNQTPVLFLFQSTAPTDLYPPSSGLENLRLGSAQRGVVITSTDGVMSPTLRNVQLSMIFDIGVLFESSSPIRASPTFERVGGGSLGNGVVCNSTGSQTQLAHFRDSGFGQGSVGMVVRGAFDVSLEGCSFYDNGTCALALHAPSAGLLQTVTMRDTVLVGSGRNEIEFSGSALGTSNLTLQRCTVAESRAASLRVRGAQTTHVSIFDSILAGQGGDVALDPGVNAQVIASNSLIRDGYASGTNGCFSADPMFRNPSSHDFRPAFGSPCIDRGIAAPTLVPVVDGDLDLVVAPDIGAYEFQPLFGYASVWTSTTLDLEVSGPLGATAVIKWSRQALPGGSTSTPFGEMFLPNANAIFAIGQTNGATPAMWERTVQTTPELFGQTYSWQALIDSPASPSGKAYSNPIEITFVYN